MQPHRAAEPVLRSASQTTFDIHTHTRTHPYTCIRRPRTRTRRIRMCSIPHCANRHCCVQSTWLHINSFGPTPATATARGHRPTRPPDVSIFAKRSTTEPLYDCGALVHTLWHILYALHVLPTPTSYSICAANGHCRQTSPPSPPPYCEALARRVLG